MGKMSKKILAGLLAVVLVLGGILLYNLQMNKSFITTFYSVTVDKPVEDLRIVLLSDLHLHEYGEDNADLVRKIQNLAPDLIAVAGDMNIDTDTQWAFWNGIRQYYLKNEDYLQKQVGTSTDATHPNKKFYDPRAWMREGEKSMVERIKEAFKELHCEARN